LPFARDAGTCVLGPDSEQIAGHRAGNVHRRDVAKPRIVEFRYAGGISVEGENRQALVGIPADPDGIVFRPFLLSAESKAIGFGAFRDDCDVRLERKQDVDLAV